MLRGAGLVCKMGLASKGWRKPGLVLNLFQCIVIFSERSGGPSFVVKRVHNITQHNISCRGALGFREVCHTQEKVWLSPVGSSGRKSRQRAGEGGGATCFFRQLISYVVFLSFCTLFVVGHGTKWAKNANIWPKMTKNALDQIWPFWAQNLNFYGSK